MKVIRSVLRPTLKHYSFKYVVTSLTNNPTPPHPPFPNCIKALLKTSVVWTQAMLKDVFRLSCMLKSSQSAVYRCIIQGNKEALIQISARKYSNYVYYRHGVTLICFSTFPYSPIQSTVHYQHNENNSQKRFKFM